MPPLFASDQVIEVTLTAPLKALRFDNDPDPEYRPATLALSDGTQLTLRVKPRGKNRRVSEVCQFPPLRLNFDSSADGTVFDGQNKLKLVTFCRRSSSFEQYILKEYLVYRIYNLLTPESFRVRLLSVTYVDPDRPRQTVTRIGFVIEDDDAMAGRNAARVAKVAAVSREELHPDATSRFEVFQYLVGNTDWAATRGPDGDHCCHNAVLIRRDGQHFIPVPYDFDHSGLVDTPYATPSSDLPIRDVSVRLFRGLCRPTGHVEAAIAAIDTQRDAIESLIRSQPQLTSRTASGMLRYLRVYFDIVSDPHRRQQRLLQACR